MITAIEDYFTLGCGRCERFATPDCSVHRWSAGLTDLCRTCLAAGLLETVKWGHPCYMHARRNIAIIGAFRGDFRLILFNAALLKDPDSILERQGPNTQVPDMIRFTDNADVARQQPVILSLLQQAMAHASAGLKLPRDDSAPDLPDELVTALDADSELSKAFHRLTPGRQKSYVLNLNAAKTPATRMARIARFRPMILAGKGALER